MTDNQLAEMLVKLATISQTLANEEFLKGLNGDVDKLLGDSK